MLPVAFDYLNNIVPQLSAGIALYIHVPFCTRKCHYCDFYSQPFGSQSIDAFVDAVVQEWMLRSAHLAIDPSRITTCYLGGGTPSLLSASQIKRLVLGVFGTIPQNIEFTIECNPDSFSTALAQHWLECGINRLSVGIQSLQPRELKVMGRCHTVAQARNLLADKVLEHFDSVGGDIMYGLPAQGFSELAATLDELLGAAPIRHLSAYELTLSPQTPFGRHQRLLALPPEQTIVAMQQLVTQRCSASGLQRYEISNFAYQGHRSEHNSSYWFRRPYIGLGPSAHSFWPPYRWSNFSDTHGYCGALAKPTLPPALTECLNREQLGIEYIFVRLRTAQGLLLDEFHHISGQQWCTEARETTIHTLVDKGWMVKEDRRVKLTEEGLLRADAIASCLL